MARTGISIQVANTVFGSPPRVDANSLLVVAKAAPTTGGTIAFSRGVPYLLVSPDGLNELGITVDNNPEVWKQVNDFYKKAGAGTVLWLLGTDPAATDMLAAIVPAVRATVVNGFQFRPRNILIDPDAGSVVQPSDVQTVIDALYDEGFATVCLIGESQLPIADIEQAASTDLPDLSTQNAPMVGTVIVTDVQGANACVGLVGGLMATLGVGVSIGDTSLPPFADSLYFTDGATNSGVFTPTNTPCAQASQAAINALGDKQYVFARTRPPRNGLWLNDGASAVDAATALSTLEAGRTIAAMVDDLRDFLTPYINSRVPLTADGNLPSPFAQVIMSNARVSVINRYVESGDISDARVSLRAKDNDFAGTRTFEVSLEILPALTLRWTNGYVFYVKSF